MKLVTPAQDGTVDFPPEGGLFPATCYVEAAIPPDASERFLPNIWSRGDRAAAIADESVRLCHQLARRSIEVITGAADEALLPLTLDIADIFIETTLERGLRLADAVAAAGRHPVVWPDRWTYAIPRVDTGGQLRAVQKHQSYQWLLLRALAGADDEIAEQTSSIVLRWRRRVALGRYLRRASLGNRSGWYAAQLGRHQKAFEELGLDLKTPPQLVQHHVLRRNERIRTELSRAFADCIGPTIDRLGVRTDGVAAVAALFGRLFPTSRVEALGENVARYDAYLARNDVDGFITAVGHVRHDANVFFMAACNRRRRPIVVVQHGGQYGYDDKIPSYVTCDLGLATHFASWGWKAAYSAYDTTFRRAEIVPMPDARMSQASSRRAPHRAAGGRRTLLIPLSKFRTLDNRLGGNVTDGNVQELRLLARDVIARARDRFDRIVVTYRGQDFSSDPLGQWLAAERDDRIEVRSAKEAPASHMMAEVEAVLWDVTATGLFESLHADVPTVALFRAGRWAQDAAWAEQLMRRHGIGVETSEAASLSLVRFVDDPDAWREARTGVQPVLDAFALARPDWRTVWRDLFARLGRGVPEAGVPRPVAQVAISA